MRPSISQSVIKSTVLSLFTLALFGCGAGPGNQSNSQSSAIQKKYTQAYVSVVSVTLMDDEPDDRRLKDKQTLEQKLPSVIKEKLEEEGFKLLTENPGKREKLVLINAKVKYDPGNKALRWVAGIFGAGKGTVEVYIEAIDPNSGRIVATEEKNDSLGWGAAGGDFYAVVEDVVEDVTENVTVALAKIRP